jgi:hypothetical protein
MKKKKSRAEALPANGRMGRRKRLAETFATSLGRATHEFLFISDVPKEVESAEIARFRALLCGRAASPLVTPGQTIQSFDGLTRLASSALVELLFNSQ